MTIPETVSPAGLRVRAELMRGYARKGFAQYGLPSSLSCARHLELAADRIEQLEAIISSPDIAERTMPKLSPRALDWICNGVPVYIRRRPADGAVYATTHDFSKFIREPPLETMRLPVGDLADIRTWEPEKDPRVIEVMGKYK